MRFLASLAAIPVLVGCSVAMPPPDPLPPPSVEDAVVLLDEIIDAGIARDWERLCANASGTCEGELDGAEERAPTSAPRVAAVEVHQPQGDADASTSGGVLFVLCGTDGLGDAFESEVLIFDGGTRLLAGAAVYWLGTGVGFAPPHGEVVTEQTPAESRCQ
jgi:hypothetical protein